MKIVCRLNELTEAEGEAIVRTVDKKKAKLERVSGRVKGEEPILRVNVRKSSRPDQTRVALTLTLRRGVLFVERTQGDSLGALDRAIDALLEEVRSFRASVFRDKQRRRHTRIAQELQEAQPYLVEQAQKSDREAFDTRLRPLLRPLYTLAVHDVRDRQVAGELPPGSVDPVEVVDEVVARAYEAFRSQTINQPLKTWLVSTLQAYLDETQEIHRNEPALHSEVRLDDRVSHNDPLDVRSLGDERLEFYQPDESLHVEDVIPDLALADPESILSAREQMRFVYRALKALPRQKRRAFLLHADGFEDLEIGMIQNRAEEDVRGDIEAVRKEILRRLQTVS